MFSKRLLKEGEDRGRKGRKEEVGSGKGEGMDEVVLFLFRFMIL